MVSLTGTGRLADDVYLLAHHDVNGKPYLHARALGLGLAGALLAELVLEEKILIRQGQLMVTGFEACRDALTQHVMDLVLREFDGYPISDWLTFLSRTTPREVACRLEASGYLTRSGRWRAGRFLPVNAESAFAPMIRVRTALDPSRQATDECIVLAGVATACGLSSRFLPYGPPSARQHLNDAIRQLSPSLRDLIGHTQAAVDSALLSHRM
jgi:hypothetical protein